MANAATSFDTEAMDTPMTEAEKRVQNILHPKGEEAHDVVPASTMTDAQPVPSTQVSSAPRTRKPRSDAGVPRPAKPKSQTHPGMVTLKLECSISEATDLLGYFMRTSHPELAHALVDAITKAQKSAE